MALDSPDKVNFLPTRRSTGSFIRPNYISFPRGPQPSDFLRFGQNGFVTVTQPNHPKLADTVRPARYFRAITPSQHLVTLPDGSTCKVRAAEFRVLEEDKATAALPANHIPLVQAPSIALGLQPPRETGHQNTQRSAIPPSPGETVPERKRKKTSEVAAISWILSSLKAKCTKAPSLVHLPRPNARQRPRLFRRNPVC